MRKPEDFGRGRAASAEGGRDAGGEAPAYRADCPCRKKGCPNFGSCGPCRARHGAKGGRAYCER